MSENPNLAGNFTPNPPSGSQEPFGTTPSPHNPSTFGSSTPPSWAQQQSSFNAPQQPTGNSYYAAPHMQPAASNPRSRLVAGLLGIFLGSLGIHRFYLGYTSIGVIQILVTIFTFGLGGLWGFIEGIMILARASSFQYDADGQPLTD